MGSVEKDYLWDHFKFNADQRLKAFNFFVVLSVFADGWVFAALEKKMDPFALFLVGGFIASLAIIFWIIDARSKRLIDIAVPGLKAYEETLDERARLFLLDEKSGPRLLRYTLAFRLLFAMQFLFGFGIILHTIK